MVRPTNKIWVQSQQLPSTIFLRRKPLVGVIDFQISSVHIFSVLLYNTITKNVFINKSLLFLYKQDSFMNHSGFVRFSSVKSFIDIVYLIK